MKALQVSIVVSACLISGTAHAIFGPEARPQLYPNKHLAQVGEARANQDIADCTNQAAGYVHNSRQSGERVKGAVGNAARGALLGTVGGAIRGNTGRGAAAGAVVGVTAGAMKNLGEQGANNPEFQKFATACLEDRGYKVIGWK